MTKAQKQAKTILQSLKTSVKAALDRKKRLGQYAVVWEKGEVVYLFKENQKKPEENN